MRIEQKKSEKELGLLKSIEAIPVQQNAGIDGFLKKQINGKPVPVRIQKDSETLADAICALEKTTQARKSDMKIVIQASQTIGPLQISANVIILPSNEMIIRQKLNHLKNAVQS